MHQDIAQIRDTYPDANAVLCLPSIPSPAWFSQIHDFAALTTVVTSERQIIIFRDRLIPCDGVIPDPGTEVWLKRVGGNFVIAEDHERRTVRIAREVEAREAERVRRTQELIDSERIRQERATTENGSIHLPVRWTSGQKRVLSGLLRGSSGNGINSKTVNHILLLEPVKDGGFTRDAYSFLCTSASGTNGRDWTGYRNSTDVGPDGPYVSEITCKQCRKLSKRWANLTKWKEPEVVSDKSIVESVAF